VSEVFPSLTAPNTTGRKSDTSLIICTAFTLMQFPNKFSKPKWTSTVSIPAASHSAGDNCTFFGCYTYKSSTDHRVVKAFPETICVIGELYITYRTLKEHCTLGYQWYIHSSEENIFILASKMFSLRKPTNKKYSISLTFMNHSVLKFCCFA